MKISNNCVIHTVSDNDLILGQEVDSDSEAEEIMQVKEFIVKEFQVIFWVAEVWMKKITDGDPNVDQSNAN